MVCWHSLATQGPPPFRPEKALYDAASFNKKTLTRRRLFSGCRSQIPVWLRSPLRSGKYQKKYFSYFSNKTTEWHRYGMEGSCHPSVKDVQKISKRRQRPDFTNPNPKEWAAQWLQTTRSRLGEASWAVYLHGHVDNILDSSTHRVRAGGDQFVLCRHGWLSMWSMWLWPSVARLHHKHHTAHLICPCRLPTCTRGRPCTAIVPNAASLKSE